MTPKSLLFQSGTRYLEAGLVSNAFQCVAYNAELFSRDSTKLFKSITEFLNANSKFSNLVLNNFRTLFVGYLIILSLIFVTVCLHRFVSLLKKNRIFCLPQATYRLTRLVQGSRFVQGSHQDSRLARGVRRVRRRLSER